MKHGSDSGTYDKEGRFVPQMFEDMFAKWDVDNTGSLSAGEMWEMIKGNRLAADPFGVRYLLPTSCASTHSRRQWGAAIFEFGTTWLLLQYDGRVSKEDLRQTYDVSAFSMDETCHTSCPSRKFADVRREPFFGGSGKREIRGRAGIRALGFETC
jgi:hypothetical protein